MYLSLHMVLPLDLSGSEAGIGSGTVFFRFFLDALIRGERPAVCRRVLIIDTRTHKNI